uniref:Uncharacterized protein n=1 Tax=Oryza glaberrima TaxID=4538 RepID=I1Q449_ORYGL
MPIAASRDASGGTWAVGFPEWPATTPPRRGDYYYLSVLDLDSLSPLAVSRRRRLLSEWPCVAWWKAVSERGDCTYGTTCLFVPQEVTGGSPQSISRIRVAARIQADGGAGPLARVGKGDGDAGPTDNGGGPACFSGLHYKAPLPRPSAGGHRCGAVATPSVTDEVAPSALLLGHIAPEQRKRVWKVVGPTDGKWSRLAKFCY